MNILRKVGCAYVLALVLMSGVAQAQEPEAGFDRIVIVVPFSSAGPLGADPTVGQAIVEGLSAKLVVESDRTLLTWDSLLVGLPGSIQALVQPAHLTSCGLPVRQLAVAASAQSILICGALEELPSGTHRLSGRLESTSGSSELEHVLKDPEDGASYLLEMIMAVDR